MQRKSQIILVALLLGLSLPVIVGFVTGTGATLPQITGVEDRIKALETAVADLQKANVALTTRVSTLETQVAPLKSTSAGAVATISSTPSANETLSATPTATTDVKTNSLNLSMVGNAVLKLPAPKNDFDVIVLKREPARLTLLVRNNTNQVAKQISVDVTARTTNGDLSAVTKAIVFGPSVVRPGEVTFATVPFGDVKLPDPENAVFEFAVNINSSAANRDVILADLQISEHKFIENRIVGMLTNPGTTEITLPIMVHQFCFDADGELLKLHFSFPSEQKVAPGKTIPFEVDAIPNRCPTYLMFATGFIFRGGRHP